MLVFWMSLEIVVIHVAEWVEIVTIANFNQQDSQRRGGKGDCLGRGRRNRTGFKAGVLRKSSVRFRKRRTQKLDGGSGAVIVIVAAVDEVISVRSKLSRHAGSRRDQGERSRKTRGCGNGQISIAEILMKLAIHAGFPVSL